VRGKIGTIREQRSECGAGKTEARWEAEKYEGKSMLFDRCERLAEKSRSLTLIPGARRRGWVRDDKHAVHVERNCHEQRKQNSG
jgi:hypothetical protein